MPVQLESKLTIIMYHYVRDLPRTRYPRIKGLLTERFEGQLDYISKYYSVCSLSQVGAAIRGESKLPPHACVLTFDDGLADHYETVLPRLLDRHFTGAFFPTARPVEDQCVLDVHKIQFILAAETDYLGLAKDLLARVKEHRCQFDIPPDEALWKEYAVANRYDPGEVAFSKRMLQWALPAPVRSEVTDHLFEKYVSSDERSFAHELYMDVAQLREMAGCGMEIGGHGYNHVWLGKLSRAEQEIEIRRTVSFLRNVFERDPSDWTMCYPFGSYNTDTTQLVAEMGCAIGLTTKPDITNCLCPLELERLDTNDLPTAGDSRVSKWTELVR